MVSGLFAIPSAIPLCASPAGNSGAAPPKNFVAGAENRLLSRALDVVCHPTPAANPLVIIGASGTGKSLILELLADEFRRQFERAAVLTTTAVDLARAYAHAVETDSLSEFRHRYSRLQLLAIDDLGRLDGKAAAQQELRQLIDSLVSRGSLVVATLRSHPLQSEELSPPLASRLSAGLVIPLALPQHEARRALLAQFAADLDVELTDQAIQRLAPAGAPLPRLTTAPQLRRAVMRLGEQVRQCGRDIDDSMIDAFLSSEGSATPIKTIVAAVGKRFGVTAGELRGDCRQHSLTSVRSLAMHLARELTGASYSRIGKHFGNRDHTTVMYACKKAAKAIAGEPGLRQAIDELKLQLAAEEASE